MVPKRPGCRRSERPTVRQLLADTGLESQKLTLDALLRTGDPAYPTDCQCYSCSQGGVCYWSENQSGRTGGPVIFTATVCVVAWLIKPTRNEPMKPSVGMRGRPCGRINQRQYSCFGVSPSALAVRWKDAGIRTLIQVTRNRQGLDGSERTEAVSYFLSNTQPTSSPEADDLFDAIRRRWRVEPGCRSGYASCSGRDFRGRFLTDP